MDDRLQELMDGATGHFWTKADDVPDYALAAQGHVELKDDNLLHIETLTSLDVVRSMYASSIRTGEIPNAIYAATKPAGAIFYDVVGLSSNSNSGGNTASSSSFRVGSVLSGVTLRDIVSEKLTSMTVIFPEVLHWSGMGGIAEKVLKHKNGTSKGIDARIRSAKDITGPTRRGITLSFSSHWSVDGPHDMRVFKNPLSVTTNSVKPKHWWDHIQPILAVQDLINMAYQGFVVADGGTATIEGKPRSLYTRSPQLWVNRLMTIPAGSKAPESMTRIPVFNLPLIGGIRGVDGWIELSRKYGRATGPISRIYRFGSGLAVETRCMEIAAAIDYWAGINRKEGAAWAANSNGTLTQCLANFGGPYFKDFVGDIDKWSGIFRLTYNRIKHEPYFPYDSGDIYTITRSAEILLQSAILNRIARNKKMTRIVCDSNRNYKIGIEVRKIVDRGYI